MIGSSRGEIFSAVLCSVCNGVPDREETLVKVACSDYSNRIYMYTLYISGFSWPQVIKLEFYLRTQNLKFCLFRFGKSKCLLIIVVIGQFLCVLKDLNQAI